MVGHGFTEDKIEYSLLFTLSRYSGNEYKHMFTMMEQRFTTVRNYVMIITQIEIRAVKEGAA